MVWLILGLIFFIGGHLIPSVPGLRDKLIARFGLNGYAGFVALPSLIGMILIVVGTSAFRGAPGDIKLWTPPAGARHLSFVLMFIAFVLFAAANFPSKIRDAVKHPQVTALAVWALAHLISNGDLLALLLFGGLLLFAIFDRISLAVRRVPLRAPATGFGGDIKAIVVGAILWIATVFWLHGLAGAPLL
ncbi:NnrU family protein [Rhodoblastus acidophilus]|jgi:uncharacterized membrane protein|uniref:NnrU family protein n=1 Tax=Rhodoblastus acidophilus TaxID=1074 RepID=A0A6N8DJQ2_RHOAC|nr:NnrU family protein [Rhodoblastus acidophilus]MCW2272536.1 putative membrane protein [Rhodoblastus acidophilus]MTV29451.1 NnrU family protein [Rhodoblastus acidophilus]